MLTFMITIDNGKWLLQSIIDIFTVGICGNPLKSSVFLPRSRYNIVESLYTGMMRTVELSLRV